MIGVVAARGYVLGLGTSTSVVSDESEEIMPDSIEAPGATRW